VKNNDDVIILDQVMIAMKHPYYVQRKSGSVALNDYTSNWEIIEKACTSKTK
jgi:methionine aminotransferase